MPNQSDPNKTNPPIISPQADLPPLPPDFQNVSVTQQPAAKVAPVEKKTESAAPPDLPPVISTTPKKKFGGGRIIATILGILLLVGGIGAGYILTQQPQLFQQQAKSCADYGSAKKRNACLNGGPGPVECPQGMVSCGASNNACTTYSECVTIGQQQNANKQKENPTPDFLTDPNNCGGAGHVCPGGDVCNAGVCAQPNLQTDPNNCGNVGIVCPIGNNCTNGVCKPNTSTSCKSGDLNAPICCTQQEVADCTGSSIVCEPGAGGGRKECVKNGKYCTIQSNSPDCTGANTPPPSETPPPTVPSCLNVTAYTGANWTQISTAEEFSFVKPGDIINFCVSGGNGTFDQAQFKINATLHNPVTSKGQGAAAGKFCQSYTVLSTDTTISVLAKIHDSVSGTWVGENF